MNKTYAEGWFRAQKKIGRLIDDAEARIRYDARKLHAVVFFNDNTPFCFIESNMKYVGVGFLDRRLREHISYQFNELEPGRLFLGAIAYREYVGETDEIARTETYLFKPDGRVVIRKDDDIKQASERAEFTEDVSHNWEPYPEFGKYDSIIRKER